jgi:hypothetical protein
MAVGASGASTVSAYQIGMTAHDQVFAKVNIPCDRGIAPLVEAMSEIKGLTTIDSCQEDFRGEASVYFTYGDDWHELAELVRAMSTRLGRHCESLPFALRLEWYAGGEWPRGQVATPPEHVAELAAAIRGLAPQISRLRHTYQSGDGTSRKGPRS